MVYKRRGYWYQSRREGRQVRTEYLGAGPLAEAEADRDRAQREAREAVRLEEEAERQREQLVDDQIDQGTLDAWARAAFVARQTALLNHAVADAPPDTTPEERLLLELRGKLGPDLGAPSGAGLPKSGRPSSVQRNFWMHTARSQPGLVETLV